jgi:hypothetical protein
MPYILNQTVSKAEIKIKINEKILEFEIGLIKLIFWQ